MKSNITLEVFESIVIEQLKERGYNTKIVETPGKLGSEHRLIKTPCGITAEPDTIGLVNPPRLIRFREHRRGFQTPHGLSSMPATLGRNGCLTTDTAQTQ